MKPNNLFSFDKQRYAYSTFNKKKINFVKDLKSFETLQASKLKVNLNQTNSQYSKFSTLYAIYINACKLVYFCGYQNKVKDKQKQIQANTQGETM